MTKRARLALAALVLFSVAAFAGARLVTNTGHVYDFACGMGGSASQAVFVDGRTSYLLSVAPAEEIRFYQETTPDGGSLGRRFPANTLIIIDLQSLDAGMGVSCISDGGTGAMALTQVDPR